MEIENCLICECHLVCWEDLHQIFQALKTGHDASIMLTQVDDFKKYRILGHGCGQCLKTWEYELQQLIKEKNKSL